MAATFHITIISTEKKVYEAEARSLVAPAEHGYVGILPNHAPFMACLGAGTITIRDSKGATTIFTASGKGYIEVSDNKAVLLVGSAELRN